MRTGPTDPLPPSGPVTPTGIIRRLGPAAGLAGVAAFMPPLGGFVLLYFINPVAIWLRDHESAGILLYAAAFAVLAGLALLPTYAQAILGGWAFGFALGFPAALAGFAGGCLIGYVIARRASGDRAVTLIKEHPRWEVVRASLLDCGYARAVFIVTLLRLPPNSPFAMTNLVLASVQVPPSAYVLGTLIGMTPRTAMAVFWATQVRDMMADKAVKEVPAWWIAAGIGLTVVVLGIIGLMAKHALDRVTRKPETASTPPQSRS